MSTKIETPEEMAERLRTDNRVTGRDGDPYEAGALAAIRARDEQTLSALRFALSSADPFPLLRALAADLGGEQTHEPPPARPGPTEIADMALRFRYWRGVFAVFDGIGNPHIARPENCRVAGLRVRIVYEHTPEDRDAALVCAESWQGRMMAMGAREVVVVGEEVSK